MINERHSLMQTLRSLHDACSIARLVLDEAHCVSQLGHDFLPDYKALGGFEHSSTLCRCDSFLALNATAAENIKVDTIYKRKTEE
jgi:superfamily II DNA helicase RecQ